MQAKEELERLRQVATDRSDLGFGSALVRHHDQSFMLRLYLQLAIWVNHAGDQ